MQQLRAYPLKAFDVFTIFTHHKTEANTYQDNYNT